MPSQLQAPAARVQLSARTGQANLPSPTTSGSRLLNIHKQNGNRRHHRPQNVKTQKPSSAQDGNEFCNTILLEADIVSLDGHVGYGPEAEVRNSHDVIILLFCRRGQAMQMEDQGRGLWQLLN